MVSTLLISEPPLQVLPSLAVAIGLNEAIILQQVHYWLNPTFNKNYFEGRFWVYNTYEKWQQQFPFWGEKTIRRVIANLEDSKVLISFITRDFKKTKYYTIDYVRLNELSNVSAKTAENLGILPSGQNDQIDLPKRADRRGQYDQIDRVNLTRSYIDTEITQKNTLPPLTPPVVQEGKREEEEEEENISEMMVGIWNEHVQSKLKLTAISYLAPKRKQALKSLIGEVFQNDLASWKAYCQQIGNCRFLMGENPNGFRAGLDWALNSDNACKVLEGAFYDKPLVASPADLNSLSHEDFLSRLHIKDHPYSEIWMSISKALVEKLGQNTYTAWFTKLSIISIADNILTFSVKSLFAKDYIRSHYLKDLEEAVSVVDPYITELRFQIPSLKGEII